MLFFVDFLEKCDVMGQLGFCPPLGKWSFFTEPPEGGLDLVTNRQGAI